MPQLIAMVIVVVGAMIYMFQTFGGTGDKIEGIAQKTSVMTEINNIRGDLIVALKAGEVNKDTTLKTLADLGYFSNQMNSEISDNATAATTGFATGEVNTYSAISFGGEADASMNLSLITGDTAGDVPGIRVHLFNRLADNDLFLEGQLRRDLTSQASIDTLSTTGQHVDLDTNGLVPAANRIEVTPNLDPKGTALAATAEDGIFTIYFKDLDGIQ